MLLNALIVGAGGFLGAILRYLSIYFITYSLGTMPYYGTLFVNCVGSFIAGCIFALPYETAGLQFRLLCVTGFLGGFTTFSAFSVETLSLLKSGNTLTGFLNIFCNVLFSIGAAFAGFFLLKTILNIKG